MQTHRRDTLQNDRASRGDNGEGLEFTQAVPRFTGKKLSGSDTTFSSNFVTFGFGMIGCKHSK